MLEATLLLPLPLPLDDDPVTELTKLDMVRETDDDEFENDDDGR